MSDLRKKSADSETADKPLSNNIPTPVKPKINRHRSAARKRNRVCSKCGQTTDNKRWCTDCERAERERRARGELKPYHKPKLKKTKEKIIEQLFKELERDPILVARDKRRDEARQAEAKRKEAQVQLSNIIEAISEEIEENNDTNS